MLRCHALDCNVLSQTPPEHGEPRGSPRVTGTDTNAYFTRKVAMWSGQERCQGVLQFLEDFPGELMIMTVKLAGQKTSFVIPDSCSGSMQRVPTGVLKGESRFMAWQSYWDCKDPNCSD